jgi:hypothetical protein
MTPLPCELIGEARRTSELLQPDQAIIDRARQLQTNATL